MSKPFQSGGQLRAASQDEHLKRFKRADKELGALIRSLDSEEEHRLRSVADHIEELRDALERARRIYLVSTRPRVSRHLQAALRRVGEPDPGSGAG
jgi:hypothetical protein